MMEMPYSVVPPARLIRNAATVESVHKVRHSNRASRTGDVRQEYVAGAHTAPSSRRARAGGLAGVHSMPFRCSRRTVRSSLSMAMYHLGALLRAGVPLSDSLDELARLEANPFMKRVWREVFESVRAGLTLREACGRHPDIFDATVLATIHAGECGDNLRAAVDELDASLAWQQDIVKRLETVLIYPVFTLLVLVGAIVFLLGSVVPSMVNFLGVSGEPMPWHTQALLSVSNAVRSHAPAFMAVVMVVVVVGALLIQRSRTFREQVDGFCLRMPVWGQLQSQFASARFSRAVAQLYGAGVALPEAWQLSEALVGNRALRRAFTNVRVAMLDGSSLGDALHERSPIPRILQRLCAVGESAGALEQALRQAAEQLQATSRYSLERAERLLGPCLLCVVGVLMGWVVLSVLVPLYDVVFTVELV